MQEMRLSALEASAPYDQPALQPGQKLRIAIGISAAPTTPGAARR